jgi:hypothetical protein
MTWQGDGILRITIKKGAEIDTEEAAENHRLSKKLASGRKYLTLVLAEGDFEVTPEARAFSAMHSSSKEQLAMAFVTTSLPQILIGNFYVKYNKPATPVSMFRSEEGAMEWLRSFLPEVLASWKMESVNTIGKSTGSAS